MKTIKQFTALTIALLTALGLNAVRADTSTSTGATAQPLDVPIETTVEKEQTTAVKEETKPSKKEKSSKENKDKQVEDTDKEAETEEEDDENDPLKQEVKRLELESSKLSLQNAIRASQHELKLKEAIETREKLESELQLEITRLKKKLENLTAEKEQLSLENDLSAAQETQENAPLRKELSRIELENSLQETQENAPLRKELSRIELEYALYEKRKALEMADLDAKQYKLSLENALITEQQRAETMALQLEAAQITFDLLKIKHHQSKRDDELEIMQNKIDRQYLQESLREIAEPKQAYLLNPVVDGYLIVSDRKIELAGPIFWGTAEYISERIDFFNNQSEEYPIFLVISESPGGSVMEGMKILKAMNASRAPVYVVIKSFAASMAAAIATLAKKSFALPDAVIVHHQISGVSFGTVTQLEEELKVAKEWSLRLLTPIAAKMNLGLDEFVQAMYKHNSTGDWQVFADEAVKLKWVDHIVKGIRDTSYLQRPDKNEQQPWIYFAQAEKVDAQGKRYVQLPRLTPFDVYHIYNPDHYYR